MKLVAIEGPFVCLNRRSIERILPHRGAALRRIDGVLYGRDLPVRIKGVKSVPGEDPDLEGHFPDAPTYPGYAQDEFVCLVAASLIPFVSGTLPQGPQVVHKTVRYKKTVLPGDTLIAEVTLKERRGRFFIFAAEVKNQSNETVAEYERIIGVV